MSEQNCGCQIYRIVSAPEHPERIIWCNLHASAARMRELLRTYLRAEEIRRPGDCLCVTCNEARAILDETEPKP